jgi:hypothetical protein
MDSKQILTTFNDHFIEFIQDIENVFPEDNEIATCKNALMGIRKANPKLIILTCKNYFSTYDEEICKGNIDFFINKNYQDDIDMGNNTSKVILDKIDNLRNPIKQMSFENKSKVIKYIQNLNKLCKIYN